MKVKYDKLTKLFTLSLEDPRFGFGFQKITVSKNCCEEEISEVVATPIRIITIPIAINGPFVIDSITIDGVVHNITNNNVSIVDSNFPKLSIVGELVDSNYVISVYGIEFSTTVSVFSLIGGIPIIPIYSSPTPTYSIKASGDGVYKFKVKKAILGGIIEETACYFVDTDIICTIVEHVEKNEKTNAHLIYTIIKESSLCNCNCDALCRLFRSLLVELNMLDKCKMC